MNVVAQQIVRAWRWLIGHKLPPPLPPEYHAYVEPTTTESIPVIEMPPVEIELPAPEPPAESKPREPRKRTEALRNEIAETVSDLIERIVSPDTSLMYERRAVGEYQEALSHLMGCDFHFVDDLMEKVGGISWRALRPDDDMRQTIWPVDIAAVSRKEHGLQFSRIFTATPASMRGRVKIVPPRTAWLASAFMDDNGEWFAQMDPIGLIGGSWLPLDEGLTRDTGANREAVRVNNREHREEINMNASIMQSLTLTERYNWHVALGQVNGPRVLLPTSPQGCLELFKTRERRDGETHRAALRHWVTNHYRETGEREIAYVRDHLRGTTEFNWRGFDACEIFVSEFDLEKNELFKTQAAEWRAKRKHNRVTVRIKRKG